jgi:group I intron endonuclease
MNTKHTAEELIRTGVYSVINLTNGKQYIGSASQSFKIRWGKHISELKSNTHHSAPLQNAFNKYLETNFIFTILEFCSKEDCLIREQHYLDTFRTYDRKFGYNVCITANSRLGVKSSEETKAKISQSNTGKKRSDEVKAKMKGVGLGRRKCPESVARSAAAHRGKIVSEETRLKLGQARKGKTHTEETKARISATKKSQALLEKTKIALRAAGCKTWVYTNPEMELITIHDLKQFCLENNLSYRSMSDLRLGKGNQHRGWTYSDENQDCC